MSVSQFRHSTGNKTRVSLTASLIAFLHLPNVIISILPLQNRRIRMAFLSVNRKPRKCECAKNNQFAIIFVQMNSRLDHNDYNNVRIGCAP